MTRRDERTAAQWNIAINAAIKEVESFQYTTASNLSLGPVMQAISDNTKRQIVQKLTGLLIKDA